MKITLEQLVKIFPSTPKARLEKYLPFVNQTILAAELSTVDRLAFFLAQIGHESMGMYYIKEVASGANYEPSKNASLAKKLGNSKEGDGVKYKGRGWIMITGRYNYEKCGEFLGLDLINYPELLEQPVNAFKSSVWYWQKNNLNKFCDKKDFKGLTKVINGAYNGIEDRVKYLNRALEVIKE